MTEAGNNPTCRLTFLSVMSFRRLLAFMVSFDLRITAGWSPALLGPIRWVPIVPVRRFQLNRAPADKVPGQGRAQARETKDRPGQARPAMGANKTRAGQSKNRHGLRQVGLSARASKRAFLPLSMGWIILHSSLSCIIPTITSMQPGRSVMEGHGAMLI